MAFEAAEAKEANTSGMECADDHGLRCCYVHASHSALIRGGEAPGFLFVCVFIFHVGALYYHSNSVIFCFPPKPFSDFS